MFLNSMYLLQYNASNMSTVSLFNLLEMAASEWHRHRTERVDQSESAIDYTRLTERLAKGK